MEGAHGPTMGLYRRYGESFLLCDRYLLVYVNTVRGAFLFFVVVASSRVSMCWSRVLWPEVGGNSFPWGGAALKPL